MNQEKHNESTCRHCSPRTGEEDEFKDGFRSFMRFVKSNPSSNLKDIKAFIHRVDQAAYERGRKEGRKEVLIEFTDRVITGKHNKEKPKITYCLWEGDEY